MKSILLIDGENFIHKIKDVITDQQVKINLSEIASLKFDELFSKPLSGFKMDKKIFYAAKLRFHQDTPKKSQELINFQRKIRNTLVIQGFEFEIAGNVRGQKTGHKIIFKEKGVDVKIAVDMVSMACDKTIDRIILCSSDSDLQPAIKEVRKRNIEIIYLGFELNPNKGLTATTNRTILFRNSEIKNIINKTQ